MELTEKIREYVKKNLTVYDDEQTLGDDDDIFARGFVDSIFAIQLVCFIEETFNIKVGDADLDIDNFSSVNRIVAFVNGKQA
ncbi:MAG: acyl carrier protein [Planctomycetota bacterium]|jgi:acyl carrier protein